MKNAENISLFPVHGLLFWPGFGSGEHRGFVLCSCSLSPRLLVSPTVCFGAAHGQTFSLASFPIAAYCCMVHRQWLKSCKTVCCDGRFRGARRPVTAFPGFPTILLQPVEVTSPRLVLLLSPPVGSCGSFRCPEGLRFPSSSEKSGKLSPSAGRNFGYVSHMAVSVECRVLLR